MNVCDKNAVEKEDITVVVIPFDKSKAKEKARTMVELISDKQGRSKYQMKGMNMRKRKWLEKEIFQSIL